MSFRKVIFWAHLVAGLVAGIVVLIMSVTGVALMYERQMLEWADKKQVVVPAGAERLSLEALIAKVRATETNAPTAITLAANPAAPTQVAFGREKTLHVNPYTGESLGEGAKGIRSFFQSMILWHRWLGTEGDGRAIGKAITGACNLAFLFLVVSGFYLWWPKKLRWNIIKGIVTFNGKLTGRARDWNWHNVIGFWSAIPLFFVVLTAVFFSYTWATPLLYKAFGEEPPAQGQRPGGSAPGGMAAATGSNSGGSTNAAARGEGRPAGERGGEGRRGEGGARSSTNAPVEVNLAGLDQLWEKAQKHNPKWETISFRVPTAANAPAVFSIAESHRGRPDLRSTLTLNWKTGEVVSEEKYGDYSPARKARTWVRYIHTGEAGGFIGQTIAGAVSAGGAVLVWTGIALSIRRFAGWRRKRAEGAEVPTKAE